jgi:hypothetical protein
MRLVVDIECDNLLEDVSKVWCIVAKDIDEKHEEDGEAIYYFQPDQIESGLSFMSEAEEIIMHNGVKYDMPVLKKLYDFKYDGHLTDTLVLSRLLNNDRPKPNGYAGKAPHSLEAWGYRLGRGKPAHDEWDRYSPEMLHRCKSDVLITEMVYYALLKEQEQ